MSNQPTHEEIAKAMSRRPVEGCAKSPWVMVDSEHGWQLWAPHGDTGSMMVAQFPAAGFDEINAELAAKAPDLQDEIQTLQALCQLQHDALALTRKAIILDSLSDFPETRLGELNDALALMPTEEE